MNRRIDSKQFNDILDRCLERLLAGETVEQCLQDYPEHADELKPLLCTASTIKQASALEPSAEFRESSRRQFLMAVRASQPQKVPRLAFWHSSWAAVPIAIVIVLLAGGGTVAAAQQAMPDQILYPVKVATENVMLTMTRSPTAKAELASKLADKRVQEIIVMADKGKPEQVQKATEKLDSYLEQVALITAASTGQARVSSKPPAATAPPTTAAPRVTTPQTQAAMAAPRPTSAPTPVLTPAPAPPAAAAVPGPAPASGGAAATSPAGKSSQEKSTPKEDKAVKSDPPKTPAKTVAGTAADVKEKQAKLKQELTRKALENPAALRAQLRQSPASVRPALERAIAVAEKRYREALENLDDNDK